MPRDNIASSYRLVSVSRLSEVCNPFLNPPWEEVASISVEGVKQAIAAGLFKSHPYSAKAQPRPWTVEDHIARIAYLATTGWSEPVEVDVGIPSMNCWVDWPLTDGNHRLAAAIVREDKVILASVAGSCDYMRELLGRLLIPKTAPTHTRAWQPV